MTERRSPADHERLVRGVVAFLQERQYREIRADLPGFERPEEIVWRKTGRGQTPDVTALRERPVSVAAATEDALEDVHCAERWRLFSEHARETGGEFFLAVPKGLLEAAWRRLHVLGVEANVWEL